MTLYRWTDAQRDCSSDYKHPINNVRLNHSGIMCTQSSSFEKAFSKIWLQTEPGLNNSKSCNHDKSNTAPWRMVYATVTGQVINSVS